MASSDIFLRKDARFDVEQLQIAKWATTADTWPQLLLGVLRLRKLASSAP